MMGMENFFEEINEKGIFLDMPIYGQGLIGAVIFVAVLAVIITTFAYPTMANAIGSISDPTNQVLGGLGLLSLIIILVFASLRVAGVV